MRDKVKYLRWFRQNNEAKTKNYELWVKIMCKKSQKFWDKYSKLWAESQDLEIKTQLFEIKSEIWGKKRQKLR